MKSLHVTYTNEYEYDCNKVLRTFCNQHGWSFVEHPNIDETCLNNHKLHLNKKGIAILASNFVNNIVR